MRPAEPLRRLTDWVALQFGYVPAQGRPPADGRSLVHGGGPPGSAVDAAISRLDGVTDALNELYATVSGDGRTEAAEV